MRLNPGKFAGRLVPARPDLAAAHLQGAVEAERFAEGAPHSVTAPVLDLRRSPSHGTGVETQLLRGEDFTVYETREDGFAWGQADLDGYVGYVDAAGLGPRQPAESHVRALWSHVYAEPDIKSQALAELPFMARIAVAETSGAFTRLRDGGWMPSRHLVDGQRDFVAQAERFLGLPYLWGGRSARGIDCSGLVQLALQATGLAAPRDADMQEDALGEALPPDAPLRRGDLIFWPGHVSIAISADTMIHANAHNMAVTLENVASAIDRIERAGEGPVSARNRLAARSFDAGQCVWRTAGLDSASVQNANGRVSR